MDKDEWKTFLQTHAGEFGALHMQHVRTVRMRSARTSNTRIVRTEELRIFIIDRTCPPTEESSILLARRGVRMELGFEKTWITSTDVDDVYLPPEYISQSPPAGKSDCVRCAFEGAGFVRADGSIQALIGNESFASFIERHRNFHDRLALLTAAMRAWGEAGLPVTTIPQIVFDRKRMLETFRTSLIMRREALAVLMGTQEEINDETRPTFYDLGISFGTQPDRLKAMRRLCRLLERYLALFAYLGMERHPLVEYGIRVLDAPYEEPPPATL